MQVLDIFLVNREREKRRRNKEFWAFTVIGPRLFWGGGHAPGAALDPLVYIKAASWEISETVSKYEIFYFPNESNMSNSQSRPYT